MSNVYGLHFGLNNLGFEPPKPVDILRHAENDAESYHLICQKLGWESKIYTSHNATATSFLDEIIQYSYKCLEGDLIIITFSGHGTRVYDINKDEDDEYDEVLVFYDKLIIDDLVKVQFSRFRKGVNIFFITDCCHSGTISKLFDAEDESPSEYLERGFDSEIGQQIFDSNIEYRIIKQSINEDAVEIQASVIHLAACQDDETASDGSVIMKHGLLTHRLLKAWQDGGFNENYEVFFQNIANQMGGIQNPKLSFEGVISDKFKNSIPFQRIHNA